MTLEEQITFIVEQIGSTRLLQEDMTADLCAGDLHRRVRVLEAILGTLEGMRGAKLEVVR